MKSPIDMTVIPTSTRPLNEEEKLLLSRYRRLRTGQQMVLVELAGLMAETPAAGHTQTFNGSSESP